MYAVVAAEQREALPLPRPGPYRPSAPQAQPVGVRHAVAHVLVGAPRPTALCGVDVRGWVVFSAVTFDTGHAAACQRCAQLVASTTRATQPARLEAVPAADAAVD